MLRPLGRMLLLLCLPAALALPAAAVERANPDPLVLLDAAKQVLGDGKMAQAREAIAKIPLPEDEPVVAEEIVLNRLLLSGSFLTSAVALRDALWQIKLDGSGYARWLEEQAAAYGNDFVRQTDDYMERYKRAPELDFVQYSVPLVSDEYLKDVSLMTDPQVVSAAVKNWDDGRHGLGEGLVASQARIAYALACAAQYDLPGPSLTLEAVARRLRAGVPVDQAALMDWVADTAVRHGRAPALLELAKRADGWIMELTQDDPDSPFRKRVLERQQPKPAAKPELKPEPKPAKKGRSSTRKRRGTSRKT